MMKIAFILCIGIAIGYAYGFRDAKLHSDNIVERTISRVGGAARDEIANDFDAKLKDSGK
jgi:hypothetical protein